jgi:transmembrane sensor
MLRTGLDEVAVERTWRRIERRRDATFLPRRPPLTARGRWVLLSFAAAALGSVLFALAPRPGAPGPLHLADGSSVRFLAAPPGAARSLVFDDGSMVTLSPGARMETLENDGRAFVTLLSDGVAVFDVQPNGPRRWSVECGLATAEVVGTRFGLERAASVVRVHVEHGTVLVRSDRLRDRVRKLTDGQSLEVGDAASVPVASASASPAAAVAPAAATNTAPGAPSATTDGASPSSAAGEWRDLARRGAYAQAYGALGGDGLRRVSETGKVADLLAVADVARLSGHPGDAVVPLARVVREHADDPRAPLAAFMLGRLELDALGDAPGAEDSFRRAIALGVPSGLLEDAYARLVEACARAGDRHGARLAAAEYAARFPRGSRASVVQRWVSEP